MVIWVLLIASFIAGFFIRLKVASTALGCLGVLALPLAMIACVALTHAFTRLSSTSALDWFFAPLWPAIGAMAGFLVAWLKSAMRRQPAD